ncbi:MULTISPECIES: lytic transglycosylase domain-containing protein [unclassified Pseudomonas]|uniref:lytic transglycosylase domain-containing protein n=1 Tax=unclassified Pseudomonas TaxID=196821 RepID=UPI000C869DC2|nr:MULTISPECIES: lytic transglycosylase domain-containing protein [unclassified Pseudomonas]PMV96440.1 lytic transglycosylase [Pseudomonas sp. GW460-C8]PMW23348.1 lytic transglycosylase [Pseudomonas sp. GW456-E6]PMW24176.1 lytic transglycosylase [Pseudomonas sp. GW456-11-11-14-TSB2]PMW40070.1 lytic transglycosylase [Pseudomonas sp. GW460-7]PMW41181.1 lytic transglycosylase [Pseudomonas sp. FW305-3-2-15-A-R2A1]
MKRLSLLSLLVAFVVGPGSADATCFAEAAARYKVSESLLRSIQVTENVSGKADIINTSNSDGSRDIGLMQINSWWLPKLASYGIGEKDLLNGCVSVNVAAWIIAKNIVTYGHTWKAVGAYNSPYVESQRIYIQKIMNNYGRSL